jgi:hypothetical protein
LQKKVTLHFDKGIGKDLFVVLPKTTPPKKSSNFLNYKKNWRIFPKKKFIFFSNSRHLKKILQTNSTLKQFDSY